jgi:3-oxoacyl-[acyl-carrier protein] reductase
MNLHLQGKRALVTGSSGGIGAAIARCLASEGTTVLIHGRDEGRAQQVVAEIKSLGGQAFMALGNISSDAGAAHVAQEAEHLVGGIDILINNAGIFVNRTWEITTAADWAEIYNTNVLAAVRMIRELSPGMRERGWGRIIQMATGEATAPFAHMPDYSASKAAMVNLTVSLTKSLAGTGITVNTVSPGIIATPAVQQWYRAIAGQQGWGETWPEIEHGVLRDVLPNTVGRLGQEEDVATLVAFLASPLAGYISGSNFRVDGGSTATVN